MLTTKTNKPNIEKKRLRPNQNIAVISGTPDEVFAPVVLRMFVQTL